MSTIRADCRWHLRVAGYHWCRRAAFDNPQAPLERLDLGCNCNVDVDYQPQEWKKGSEDAGRPPKRVLEWEDEG